MRINNLNISLQPFYSENAGKYVASVDYEHSDASQVKLILEPEMSTAMLQFLGPVIARCAAQTADKIRADLEASAIEAGNAAKLIEA